MTRLVGIYSTEKMNIVGHMYVFGGPWQLLNRGLVEKSIENMETAINHENNVHLDPSINELTPSLQAVEAKSFPTEKE